MFIVKDFTDVKQSPNGGVVGEPKLKWIGNAPEMIAFLDKAKEEGLKISVYSVDACSLDWS